MSELAPTSVESAPAPAVSLDSLNSDQLSTWRMTGNLPDAPTSQTPPPESSPDKPVEQAAETAAITPPASEPGKPPKNDAETRIAELLAERARLRADLDAARASKPSDAPRPASEPATARSLAETIQTPDLSRAPLTEDAFFAAFPESTVGDFARYVASYEFTSRQQAQTVQQHRAGLWQSYATRIDDALKTDPEFLKSIDPRLANARPAIDLAPGEVATSENAVAQEIMTSEIPDKLLRHLSSHPDELNRLLALPSLPAISRAIGRLEASLSSTAPPPAPAGSPVSLAPPPTPTLGKKPAQPADELSEAIKSGDFARYRELQNRKEMRSA